MIKGIAPVPAAMRFRAVPVWAAIGYDRLRVRFSTASGHSRQVAGPHEVCCSEVVKRIGAGVHYLLWCRPRCLRPIPTVPNLAALRPILTSVLQGIVAIG